MRGVLSFIASVQQKFPYIFFLLIILFVVIIGTGLPKLEVQSDFSKENPRHLPAFQITDRISDEFGGEIAVMVVIEVEENSENDRLDLRDPEVINFLVDLENSLEEDARVVGVSSIGSMMKSDMPQSKEDVRDYLDENIAAKDLFSDDYRLTLLTITTNIGEAYEDIVPFEEMLLEKIDSVGVPGGTSTLITGGPSFGKVIRELVFSDAFKTLSIAAVGIFLFLLITERSLKNSLLVFLPLVFSLILAGGIIGHIEMKLSIACVALGSIILGLGVEYGVFMLTRYNEERFIKKKTQHDANVMAVSSIGTALLGSGITTMAGFLALTFSITPMMQVLGLSLAIGIICAIFSAIFISPLLILIAENLEMRYLKNNLGKEIVKERFYNSN